MATFPTTITLYGTGHFKAEDDAGTCLYDMGSPPTGLRGLVLHPNIAAALGVTEADGVTVSTDSPGVSFDVQLPDPPMQHRYIVKHIDPATVTPEQLSRWRPHGDVHDMESLRKWVDSVRGRELGWREGRLISDRFQGDYFIELQPWEADRFVAGRPIPRPLGLGTHAMYGVQITEREVEDWPDSCRGEDGRIYCDFDRDSDSGVIVCKSRDIDRDPDGFTPMRSVWVGDSIPIHTDSEQAPADALLEGLGHYIRPWDRCRSGMGCVYRSGPGGDSSVGWDYAPPVGWDPYSWDVKPDRDARKDRTTVTFSAPTVHIPCKMIAEMAAAIAKTPPFGIAARTPTSECPECHGAKQVHGALGVGIMWPCRTCDGKGVV